MESGKITFLKYAFLVLGYASLCAAENLPEELTVRVPTGEPILLRAYICHLEFLTNLHRTIDRKVQAGAETLLRYVKPNPAQPDYFLANIHSNQYFFLQLVQSLASKDVIFSNHLLQEFQRISIEGNPISDEWLRSNIRFPTESMYSAVQSIVYADSIGMLDIPEEVKREILLMANKSELFHRSCEEGDLEVSEWLLSLGEDYDLVPLLENSMNNSRVETAKLLLRNGALKNMRDIERIKHLLNTTLIHVAAASNAPEAVSVLVEAGAPINAVDEAGRSPLHIALQHNDTVSAKKLLSKGADVKLISNSGDTALHIASSMGNVDAVKLLLKYFARFDVKNILGLTPMNIAEQSSIFYIIEYLIQQNIKIPSAISTHSNVLPHIYILNDPALSTYKNDSKKIENYCEVTRLFNSMSLYDLLQENDFKTKLLELVIKNGIPFLTECLINLEADMSYTNSNNETLLFNAVRTGSSEIVITLINKGIDVGAKDVNGATALHVAAGNGFLDIVSLLLKKDAKAYTNTNNGLTPLHKAAANGHLEVVKFFLDMDTNIDNTVFNTTPLELAAFNGHMDVVQYFMKRGLFNDPKRYLSGTALHSAAKAGQTDIVNFLLDSGYNVNVADKESKTPLFFAAYGGSASTVQALLERGADIQTKTKDAAIINTITRTGETPLHMAALNGHLEVCKMLLDKGIDKDAKNSLGESPLFYAATGGHYNVVKYLVEKKSFKNGKNIHGSTALHAAAEGGHNDVIDYLFENGMDIDRENNYGQTPLHYACEFGHFRTVQNLIRKLATVSAGSDYGTPLSVAVREGYEDIAAYLLENGAAIEATDNQGNSPLMEAIMRGHKDVVELLLWRGASLNAESKRSDRKTPLHLAMNLTDGGSMALFLLWKGASLSDTAKDGTTALFEAVDNRKETVIKEIFRMGGMNANNTRKTDQFSCLHMAVIRGSLDIVEILLNHGAYVNALDAESNTPLHFAVSRKEIEIARLLLERGADVKIKNEKEQTPLHLAKTLDSPKVAKTLRLCDCE